MSKKITLAMTTIVVGIVLTGQAVRSQEASRPALPEVWKDKVQRLETPLQLKPLQSSDIVGKMSIDSTDLSVQKIEFSKVGLSDVLASETTSEKPRIKHSVLEKSTLDLIVPQAQKIKSTIISKSIATPETMPTIPTSPIVTEPKNPILPSPESTTPQTIVPTTPNHQIQTQYGGVTVFGDSLSDNGNLHRISHGTRLVAPEYFQGRASNGAVWSEKIAPSMQLQNPDANFAVGGENTTQIQQHVEDWVQKKVATPEKQIYIFWGGTNDYGGGVSNPSSVVENIQTSIKTLKAAGARTILIPNLPHFAAASQSALLSQDSLIQAHNKALHDSLVESTKADRTINVIPLDIRALSNNVMANPSRFGLTNAVDACLTGSGICANPDQSVWWDWVHPSAAMHGLIADYTMSILKAPQTIAPQMTTSLDLTKRAGQDVGDRLIALQQADSTPMGKLNVFVLGSVQSGKQTDLAIGFDSNRRGFTMGADYRILQNFTVGMAFTSAQGTTMLNDDRGKIVMDGSALSAYGSYRQGRFFADGIASYGWNQLDLTRKVQVTGFNEAHSSTGGKQVAMQVKAGYDLGSNHWSVVPTIGVSYASANLNAYNEQNADVLNLKVGAQSSNSVAVNVGTRIAYDFRSSLGTITPYVTANYSHTLTDGSREITTELATQPGILNRTSVNGGDRDIVRLGLGVQAKLLNSLTFNLSYEKAMSQNAQDQSIQGRLNYAF